MKTRMIGQIGTLLVMLAVVSSVTHGFEQSDYTWHEYNGHQYAITLNYSTWAEAEALAVEVGGHLVTINDFEENAWVAELIKDSYCQGSGWETNPHANLAWIGLECVDEPKSSQDSWVWISGEPITFWNPILSPWYDAFPKGGIHMYIHGANHDTGPYTWNNNVEHDGYYPDGTLLPRGVIEIAEPLSPAQQIQEILDFVDDSVAGGTLVGVGSGKSAKNKLNAFINMLEEARNLIGAELFAEACVQLQDAYQKCDGESPPPDFVAGSAVSELASRIQTLRESMNCSEYGAVDFINDMPCGASLYLLWVPHTGFEPRNAEMVADVVKFSGSAADELRSLEEQKHLVTLALFAGLNFDGLVSSFLQTEGNLKDFLDDLAKDKAPELALEAALTEAGAPSEIVSLTIALFQFLQSYHVAANIANSTGDVYIVLPEYPAYELPLQAGRHFHNGILFATDDFEEDTLSELSWLWDVIKYDSFDEKTIKPNRFTLGKANWNPLSEQYEPVPNYWLWDQGLYDWWEEILGKGWGWYDPDE